MNALRLALAFLAVGLTSTACSSVLVEDGQTSSATGGASAAGGASSTGGWSSTGGTGTTSTTTTAGAGGGVVTPPPACPGAPWSRSYGNAGNDQYPLAAAVVDGDCSVIFAGMVLGAVDLGGGLEGSADLHLAVVKLDAAGAYVWSRQFPPGAYFNRGKGLAVDGQGNVYVGGLLEGTADFGGGPIGVGYSGSSDDLFLAKLDEHGEHLWSKAFHGDVSGNGYLSRDVHAIAAAASGDVLITGVYGGSIDFGGGPLPSAYSGDGLFLARFDAAGHLLAQEGHSGQSGDAGWGLATRPDGSYLLLARCGGDPSLGGASDQSGACLVSYDPTGATVWSRFFPGGGNLQLEGLALDSDGGLLFGGYGDIPIDFGGGPLGTFGMGGGFVARLDAAGHHLWSHAVPGGGVLGAAVTPAHGAAVTGYLGSSVSIGDITLTPVGDYGAFVMRFDAAGSPLAGAVYGSAFQAIGNAIAVDPQGHAYISGSFSATIDLGEGALAASGGHTFAFAARLPD